MGNKPDSCGRINALARSVRYALLVLFIVFTTTIYMSVYCLTTTLPPTTTTTTTSITNILQPLFSFFFFVFFFFCFLLIIQQPKQHYSFSLSIFSYSHLLWAGGQIAHFPRPYSSGLGSGRFYGIPVLCLHESSRRSIYLGYRIDSVRLTKCHTY